MSKYTGKIELGNVVLTGQGTVNTAETSINVTIPDYTEQPFTIVFDTSGNTPLSSYTLNLGCGDDSEYKYRVRHLKIGTSEITFGEWSDTQEDILTETGIGDNYNAIQIIGSGISYTALSLRRIHGKLISIIDNNGNEKEYSVVGNINSLFGADINKTGATEESALISSYMSDESLSNFNGIYAMFEGDTKITDAYYLYLPYTTIPERGYGELFSDAVNLKRGPYRIGPLNMQTGQGSVGDDGCNSMFLNCTNMVKGPKELKFGSLAESCYYQMFYNCTSLTTAPELPATGLTNFCYYGMFGSCTSLSTAPELPATGLAQSCYAGMFYNCASLTTAPDLPATGLADHCYYQMFSNCTSLTTAPDLHVTTLADSCYYQMFFGCTSLTTAPRYIAVDFTSMPTSACTNMFEGCTSLTTAPELLAGTLGDFCYLGMFMNCTGLTTAPHVLPAESLKVCCYASMFEGCTSLTTAPVLPATELANSCYNAMFAGCTSLMTAPELPVTELEDDCYSNMFNGCTSLTTAPKLPATELTYRCYNGMFQNCTSLTVAPYLPAEKLVDHCYDSMFQGCSSLNWIAAMFESCEDGFGVMNWVDGVADNGTFVANILSDDTVTGASEVNYAVPNGWGIDYAVPIGGVAWRTRNIGAEDVIDTGLYFQWGDISGYTASQVGSGEGQKYFGWADYKYNNGGAEPTDKNMTKYNSTDDKTVLDLSDDAASANLGGLWRMPTKDEYVALGDAVKAQWQDVGVNGLLCFDHNDEAKELFFPAVGLCANGVVNYGGSNGYYWSGSLGSGSVIDSRFLVFNSEGAFWEGSSRRCYGLPVRAVIS